MNIFERLDDDFNVNPLSLPDHLSAVNTILANERTLLAYWRTALAMGVTGITMIKILQTPEYVFLGIVLVVISVLTSILGYYRYFKMKNIILKWEENGKQNSIKNNLDESN